MRMLIFGDSITQGFYDIEGGWVGRLRKHYDQLLEDGADSTPPTVFNLGISGDMSIDVLNRIENEIKARRWPGEELAVVINSGLNDSRLVDAKTYSTPGIYQKTLQSMIGVAKKYSTNVIVVGLTPCVESRTNPAAWSDTSLSWNNERIAAFNDVAEDTAAATGCMFIEVFSRFAEQNQAVDLLPDGLHPNSAGHEVIFQIVKQELANHMGS